MSPKHGLPAIVRSKRCFPAACSSFLLACLLAFTLQILFFSPISPAGPLDLPLSSSVSSLPANNKLQVNSLLLLISIGFWLRAYPFEGLEYAFTRFLFRKGVLKLGEGFLKDPEDVCVDKEGIIYAATRDGWIKRLHRNGSWENWKMMNSRTLLGITITKEGDLIVCDSEKGLIRIGEDGVNVLATHVNGSKIRFADDVIEASDGNLYFSVASTKFELHNWYLDVLEGKPHGQLLKYDPSSTETLMLLDGLCFANGVALSRDEDYLVVCETWKFRCLKYWLKGEDEGKTEIFIDNLPGGPDNINLAPDGSFWIALLQLTSERLEFVHTSKASKHLVATFPKLIEKVNGVYRKATVVNVAADGNIIRRFDDPNGKVMSFVTAALEFEDHLYLGSLNSNFVGKLPLKDSCNLKH